MKFHLAACATLAAASATVVGASTPAAWAELDARVARTCIAASGMARPRLLASKAGFSDAIGLEVRMLRGTDRRGGVHREICAFNRRTGQAEVQDADGWFATPAAARR